MAKKCLVKNCPNTDDQGAFVGDLCSPCHDVLSTGKLKHMFMAERLVPEVSNILNAAVKLNSFQYVNEDSPDGELDAANQAMKTLDRSVTRFKKLVK